jgi:hypothetical protein
MLRGAKSRLIHRSRSPTERALHRNHDACGITIILFEVESPSRRLFFSDQGASCP